MIYFIIPVLMIIYFELLGRWISLKFKRTMHIYFPIGFLFATAIIYPSLLITINNLSFYLILVLYVSLFIVSVVLIVKDIKKIDRSINMIDILLILLIGSILTYYSYNTSLGNLHGFDSLYYINFTVNNIGKHVMNSSGVYLNGPLEESLTYYTGQTYYYFAGVVLYIFGKFCALFKIEYFYETAFIWVFQIIFDFLYSSIILEAAHRTKNKTISFVSVLLLVFMLGKVYFNNVYGFFGNSLLLISISYMTLFLYDYFNNKEKKDRYFVYILLISGCALSSSGIFILLFSLIALFFFEYNTKNLYKEYAIVCTFPLINAFNMERYSWFIIYGIPALVFIILYFGNDFFSKSINKKVTRAIFVLLFIGIFIASRFYSEGLFDFSGLLNNSSQSSDMTLDYFSLSKELTLENIYKVFVLLLIPVSLFTERKNNLYEFFILLIILFFNPFNCNLFNHFISVYYRAYSIIVNPFVLILSFDLVFNRVSNNAIKYGICTFAVIFIVFYIDFINPIYYHYEHKPSNDYNYIYKMDNDKIDVIRELKSEIINYDNKNPYIITGNLLTQGMINNARYIYGRTYLQPDYWTNSDRKLFEIFYPSAYLGDVVSKNPNYDNMLEYIVNAKVDYIVVDKREEYYDKEKKDYSYLFYKVSEVCGIYPIYENDTYAIYHY